VKALNVFHHLTYEGAVNIDEIDDPVRRMATIGIIDNFGQTPKQLFKRPHPQRKLLPGTNQLMWIARQNMLHRLVSAVHPIKDINAPVGQVGLLVFLSILRLIISATSELSSAEMLSNTDAFEPSLSRLSPQINLL
jgi:hypothetical protein